MKRLNRPIYAVSVVICSSALCLSACEPKGSNQGVKKSKPSGSAGAAGQSLPTGQMGKAFDLKEVTALASVLADPKAYKGKKIHVKGVVVAHCHHRRAWFAVATTKDSKQKLRVWTKHEFLVPKTVKHGETLAEAEGVVEIQTVPEKQARHLATEHGLFGGDASKINGPQYLPSLRVTGARFKL
jgi:hypothetical protein